MSIIYETNILKGLKSNKDRVMEIKEMIFVNNDGIKIRYDNRVLKMNYRGAYLKLCIANGINSDNNKLGHPGKDEWKQIYNQIDLPVLEFNDEYLIIQWDAVESWETKHINNGMSNFTNITKIKGLEIPFEICVTDIELEQYFNKIVPEKRLNKIDITRFLKLKRYMFWLSIILIIMFWINIIIKMNITI